jgi:hypothetical protein
MKMNKYHDVQKVLFQNDEMLLTVDGQELSFPLTSLPKRLRNASQQERETFEISPSGYGIHWPLLDEDLSLDGLLGIKHNPKSARAQAAF